MKKLITLVIAGGMLAFYSCGPSAEEIAAKEKATQDSIAAVEAQAAEEAAAKAKAIQDSTDAANEAAAEKAKQDSIDAAAAKKGGSKPKPKPAEVKPGQGRG